MPGNPIMSNSKLPLFPPNPIHIEWQQQIFNTIVINGLEGRERGAYERISPIQLFICPLAMRSQRVTTSVAVRSSVCGIDFEFNPFP